MERQKHTRPTAPPAAHPAPGRPVNSAGSDAWRLDPSDVARHAQLRRRSEQRGPLGKALRYSAVVLVLAGAFAAYWNFDTLRNVTVESPALSALFKSPSPDDARNRATGVTGNAEVESSPIVGTAAPTSVSDAHDREPPVAVAKVEGHAAPSTESREAPAADSRRAAQSPSAADGVAAAEPAVQSPAPPPAAALPPKPAPPPVPETIGFALPKFTVSERDASAAVLVVRNGGNRGPSVFTWWTSDGTANAGKDYVDLGKVVVKFAAGEENRTIHIPIVGDEVAEGPESFYVNLAAGDNPSAEPQDRVEVVIEDDDSR